ncbi:MAG TPA: hypothetical protein VMW63_07540 [Methanoregulaceae archaeon]|nr:hypothetical protein [Methanoregulaceae archaeon]
MRKNVIFIVGLLALFTMTIGFACADPSIPSPPETQGISISIVAQVNGGFSEKQETSWQTSTSPLGSGLTYPNPSFPMGGGYIGYWPGNIGLEELFGGNGNTSRGGVLYETVYSESTSATSGTIDYVKQFSADTGNKLQGTSNIEAQRVIVFTTDTSGRLVSSENLMLDSAGQFSLASEVFTCPFAPQVSEILPQFCNRVEMGSDLDISGGSVSTAASERFVSATGDYPVTSDYRIRLTGIGDQPAQGSVSAFMDVQAREGMVDILARIPFEDPDMGTLYVLNMGLASELQYEELTAVYGQITLFEKDMRFESGMIR